MAEEERDLIEILDENISIDIAKYINHVHSPHCGAISTFSGTTRDRQNCPRAEIRGVHPHGNTLHQVNLFFCKINLEPQLNCCCAPPWPGPGWGNKRIHCYISRADSLDACKYVVDEVKASVPIWKKEVYTNGEVWKENSEFLERRDELGNEGHGNVCCGKKVLVEVEREKRGCCAGKVKVDVEDS